MSTIQDIFVSVVVVTDQHSKGIRREIKAISELVRSRYSNYEIVVVDNHVAAREMHQAAKLLDTTPCVRIIKLSRPSNRDVCVFAGLEAAIGDVVVIKLLHDPLRLVPSFVRQAQEHDMVFGVSRQRTRAGVVNHYGARLFYWYNKRFLRISIPENATYFMALNRRAVNALTRYGRNARHIRYLARQIGYSSKELAYDTPPQAMEHKPIHRLMASALELSTNYSNRPLRFVAWLGFFGSFLNLLYVGYVLMVNVLEHNVAQGWTTLSLQSAAMFFLLFAIMAIVCEYLGKVLQETQGDAPYHIADELNSKVSVADATRRNITS